MPQGPPRPETQPPPLAHAPKLVKPLAWNVAKPLATVAGI
jgi:hypothetical protein